MYNHNASPYQDSQHEIVAHMTPVEVRELAQLQGGMEHDPRTRLPSFRRLADLMGHPQVHSKMIEWEGNRFAGGGEVDGINDFLRKSGRYGDTEAVMLPRVVANLFDRALTGGHPSINPRTGKREYFLGGLLGSLGSIFSPISHLISPIAKTIAPLAGSALSHFGPQLGSLAGTALGGLASSMGAGPLGTALGGMAGNALGGLAGQVGQSLSGGTSIDPSQLARQTASNFGQQAAPAIGQHFGNMGQNYASQMRNPYAASALSHASNMAGQMFGNMGAEGANAFGANRAPQFGQQAAGTAQNYLGGIEHPIAHTASNMLGGMYSVQPNAA